VRLSRLAAAGGVAGPVLFTVAWVVSSLRQAGHSAAAVQLSGLAAEDARDPQIMMAGFVVLGAGTVVFGAGLGLVTAPAPPREVPPSPVQPGLRASITSVSPGQSQKIPSAERLASRARTSLAKSSRRSPNRCGAEDERDK
jgi:hypothetical protein